MVKEQFASAIPKAVRGLKAEIVQIRSISSAPARQTFAQIVCL